MSTRTGPDMARTGWVLALLLCSAGAAQAQFTYQAQTRSVTATANAVKPVETLVFPSVCDFPVCGPTGLAYPLVGDRQTQTVAADVSNVGTFDGAASVNASADVLSGSASASIHSDLTATGISMVTQGHMAHVGPAAIWAAGPGQPLTGPPHAAYNAETPMAKSSAAMTLTFTLDAPTLVDLSFSSTQDGTRGGFAAFQLRGPDSFSLGLSDLSFSQTRTLAAGQYTLQATHGWGVTSYSGQAVSGSWSAQLTVRAVPEASTTLTMGMGLVALLAVTRRRRGTGAKAGGDNVPPCTAPPSA